MDKLVAVHSLFVKYGYYMGCSPYHWNDTSNKLEISQQKWKRWLWLTLTIFCFFVYGAQVWEMFAYFEPGIIAKLRVLKILGLGIGIACQLNNLVKHEELKEITNLFLIRFCAIEADQVLPSLPVFARKLKGLLLFIGIIMHSVPLLILQLGIAEHKPKFWIELAGLAVKKLRNRNHQAAFKGSRENWNTIVAIFAAIMEGGVTTLLFCSMSLYLSTLGMGVVSFTEMLKKMKSVVRGGAAVIAEDSKLLSPEYWIIMYKSLYMILQRFLNALSDFVIVYGLATIIFIMIYINYIILATGAKIYVKISCTTLNILLALFLSLTVRLGSFVTRDSTDALRGMKQGKVAAISRYNLYRLRSCKSIRVNVGPFFDLDETTVPEIGRLIIESTIDAVLTFP